MDKIFTIAIDGPAGAGKTTIAKALSKRLNVPYVSTGALYRAFALKCINLGLDPNDESVANSIAKSTDVQTFYKNGKQVILLDGADVTDSLYCDKVSQASSQISTHKVVRQSMLNIQRNIAKSQSVIMDGRDIGSVVLPNANFKFYLDSDVEVRAKRRYDELKQKGEAVTYEEVLEDLKERDYRDKTRDISPLLVCPDAIVVDSTNIGIEETVDQFLQYIEGKK